MTGLVVCVLVFATPFEGGARGGRSLWLKMAMYVGVAVSFAAVFYAVCLLAVGVLGWY